MRVLHLVNGEVYAGAERVQDHLAARLPELGVDIGFACLKPGLFPKMRRSQSTPLYEIAMRGRCDLTGLSRLADIVRREGYDILHAHTPRSVLVGRLLAAWTGRPLVYHAHSPTSRDTTHRWRNFINTTVERCCLRGAKKIIAVSHSLGEHMRREGYQADRISVTPNGVPAPPIMRNNVPPQEEWLLGAVALIRPRKGLEVLLQALSIVRQQGLPVRLKVVGPFENEAYEAELKTLADQQNVSEAIEWAGFQHDVPHHIAMFDLFILPSLFGEGLPMVVLEAMAAGVPVVGSEVEGVPEAIRNGVDGLLVRPQDPQHLAEAIAKFVGGDVDWAALRASALRRHAEHFSDRSMAAGVAAAYRQVLQEAGVVA